MCIRRTIQCLALSAFLAGCNSSSISPMQPVTPPRLQTTDGWQRNETLMSGTTGDKNYRYRSGVSKGGNPYTIFADGSGSLKSNAEDWSISCKLDSMTDIRNCSLYGQNNSVFIDFKSGTTAKEICVLGNDFPGRTGAIRVDKNSALTTNEAGCVPGTFISALRTGATVHTRIVKWPYDYYVDKSGSLAGVNEAIELTMFIRASIGRLSF